MTPHNSVTAERKHTPTPWRVSRDSEGALVIFADDGQPDTPWTICEMCMMADDDGTPNAELIVKAVNEREALLNTCAELKKALEDCRKYLGALSSIEAHNLRAKIDTALTAAQSSEGGAG